MDWVRACKESPESRVPTKSDFAEAGPFNEMVVMGVLAVRLQGLNKELEWNGEKMEFTNLTDSETVRTVIEDAFTIADGHPTFNKKWTEPMNAKQFAAEMVKHNYRNGWSLPAMPSYSKNPMSGNAMLRFRNAMHCVSNIACIAIPPITQNKS